MNASSADASTGATPSVWHKGEIALQATIGAADRMAAIGHRIVRNAMPDQHREFFAEAPFAVLGSVDGSGDAWATVLSGVPGFISSPDPKSLEIHARRDPLDPAGAGLGAGEAIGLLGIDLHTRRRNRVNGRLVASGGTLRLGVEESFGNCPKYIQVRDAGFARDPRQPFSGEVLVGEAIDREARDIIERADTFFVASYVEQEGQRKVDVSHRGGRSGFVRVGEDGQLTIPDFAGNQFFATLGNILANGRAGLAFVDFESGDLLQMTGDAEVILESPEIEAFEGAERLWTFRPRKVVRRPGALPLRWAFSDDGWSPYSLMTGAWASTSDRHRAGGVAR